ncbi:MAG: hypothetical protein GY827_07800 [Cytophagales bacterium]|nr:hypothetical protein [Cytophagales bacterium]
MIKVYTKEITNRINYTFDLIFSTILGVAYEITTSQDELIQHQGAKLIYAKDSFLPNVPFIEAHGLLTEDKISKMSFEVTQGETYPIFFQTQHSDNLIPFDVFSCSFYLVSRYEEYLPYIKDKHGRFEAKNSLAYKNEFLKKPVVNQYAFLLKEKLQNYFPELVFPVQKHSFQTTLDIDNAFAYRFKGFGRTCGALTKKLFSFKIGEMSEHLAVIFRMKRDPYNSYEKQLALHKKYNLQAVYFFLLGNYSKYDHNISHRNKGLQKLIHKMRKNGAKIGIHPSYASFLDKKRMEREKGRAEKIIKKEIRRSRQHYLRLKIPETYQQLNTIGITDDYSMGYASKVGFRASICTPFKFYDLSKEEITNLTIHPFCIMDTTLKDYLKVRSGHITEYLTPMFEEVKKVGGEINIVFHNESIGAKSKWKNWENVYEDIIQLGQN